MSRRVLHISLALVLSVVAYATGGSGAVAGDAAAGDNGQPADAAANRGHAIPNWPADLVSQAQGEPKPEAEGSADAAGTPNPNPGLP